MLICSRQQILKAINIAKHKKDKLGVLFYEKKPWKNY